MSRTSRSAVEVRNLIKSLPGRGATALVCTHRLAEIEMTCDYVIARPGSRWIEAGWPRDLSSTLPAIIASVGIGFGFGLPARSFGGGSTIAIAFVYVLGGVLSFMPGLRKLTFEQFSSDLSQRIAGSTSSEPLSHAEHGALVSVIRRDPPCPNLRRPPERASRDASPNT
jgi:hypothetical protein